MRRRLRPHIQRFGTARGPPDGGVFVVDVEGSRYFYRASSDPQVAALRRGHETPSSVTTAVHVLGVDPIRQRLIVGTGSAGPIFNRGRETGGLTRHPDGSWTVRQGRRLPVRCRAGRAGPPWSAIVVWVQ